MQRKGREETSQNNWITPCSAGVSTLRGSAPFVPKGSFGITPSSADSLSWYISDTLVLTSFILTGWIPVYFQVTSMDMVIVMMYQTIYQTIYQTMYQTMSRNRNQMMVMNPWFVNQKSAPWMPTIDAGHRVDSERWRETADSSCVHGSEDFVVRVIITRCTGECMLTISTHPGSSVSSAVIMSSMIWEQVSVSADFLVFWFSEFSSF